MSSTLAIALILIALAILITAAMTLIAIGHQSEERPGTIDLTGIKPRTGWSGPSASRVRAEAAFPVVVDARMPRDVAAMVGDGVVDVFRVSDGAHVARTTLGELAGQPRGDEVA